MIASCCLVCIDAVAQWVPLQANTTEDLRSIHYRSNGNVWMGAFDTLQWSVNSGTSFIERPTTIFGNVPIYGLYLTVHALDNNTALMSGTMNTGLAETIYRTTDAGLTWTEVHYEDVGPIDLLWDIEFAQPPLGFAVGSNGRILRSNDAGLNWTAISSGTTYSFQRIAWATGGTYIAAGPSAFMRSTNSGLSWLPVTGPSGAEDLACQGNTCYAADAGAMWKSLDGGATWNISGTSMGNTIEMLDGTTLIAANDTGLFRSTSSGLYWEQFDLPSYQPVNQIDFFDAVNGIAVGENGYAIRTGNAGGPSLPIALITPPSGISCTGVPLTFNNPGDPSYSYQWSVNGVPVSTEFVLDTTFFAPGTYTIELFADNGTGTDAVTMVVTVIASPEVVPFTASAAQDTICLNSSTTITVPSSQSGTFYRLSRDGVQQGNSQSGGGTLNFSTGTLTAPALFTVLGIRSNTCGADTFAVDVPINVPYVPDGNIWVFTEPEGCVPYTPIVRIENSSIGFHYKVNSQSFVQGNGGILDIPMPQVNSNSTVTATVRVAFIGSSCPGVVMQNAQSIQVYNVSSGFYFEADPGNDPAFALVGQPRTVGFNAHASIVYQWDFGADATPATYTGQSPPSFQYASTGPKTVTQFASAPLGFCSFTNTASITVVDSAAIIPQPICSEGAAGLDAYIADMCLDAHNNRYVTGYRQTGGNNGEAAFFAMKIDSMGQEVWRYLGPSSGDWQSYGSYGYGIAADRAGNAYITGRFDHENRTINGVSIYHPNFLVKLDQHGELEWQMTSPTNKFFGVVCTDDDVVHVVGRDAWAGTNFSLPSGDVLVTSYPAGDPQHGNLFLLDVSPEGEVLDQRMFGHGYNTSTPTQLFNIGMNSDALDTEDRYRCDPILRKAPDGSLLIAGIMQSIPPECEFDFQTITMQSHVPAGTMQNVRNVYGLRYEPDIGVTDAYAWAGGNPQTVQGIAQGPNGQYVVCGRYKSPFLFNGADEQPEPPALYNQRYFSYIISADSAGEPLWHGASPSSRSVFHDVEFAPDGTIHALASFNATSLIPAGNGAFVGAGSGDANLDHAFVHYGSDGALLGIDPSADSDGVAFNLRPDACGNLHVVALTAGTSGGTEHGWISCGGCPDNLRTTVIAAGGCAPNCFAASDPSFRDVGMVSISLSDTAVYDPTVRVSLRNMGQVEAQEVVIGYQVNEGPPQYAYWNGILPYGGEALDLAITSLSFLDRHSNRVVAWVDQVNGSSDDLAANDTLRLTHLRCFEPLQGSYSCGGDGAYFRTFSEATQALSQCGISTTTIIALSPGTYLEQLHVRPIPGVTSTDTVVFTSAASDSASVRLRFLPGSQSGLNTVVAIETGVMGVSLTDLTIDFSAQGSGLGYGRFCTDLNIVRCRFQGRPFVSQSGLVGDRGSKRIRIDSCTFEFGSSGIHLFGVNHPDSPTLIDSLTWVRNNVFLNQTVRSMFLDTHVGLVVQDNTIISDAAYNADNYSAVRAFAAGSIPSAFDRNFIRIATTALPISGGSNPNSSLVRLNYQSTSNVRNSVRNNMVFNPLQVNTNVIPTLSCECENADFLHNTVRGVAVLAAPVTTDSLVVRNNIFMTGASLFAVKVAGELTGWVSNDNVFSSGPNGDYSIVIEYQGFNRSLAWWQANTGHDQGSVQQLPQFVAADDVHLEPAINSFSCPSLPSVPTDIDGDLRNPVITRQGADEGDLNVAATHQVPTTNAMMVFPNPNSGQAMLFRSGPDLPATEMIVLDAGGRRVHRSQVVAGQSSVPLLFDLAPGLYQLRLSGVLQGLPMVISER
jgi:photosystem II stability/assembly factor-like uncharacterized protein